MRNRRPGVPWTLAVSIAMLAWLAVSPAAAAGARWAIVIGIDQYESDDIPRLGGAVADAEAMAEAFKRYVEVPPANVVLLTSAGDRKPTKAAITEAIIHIRNQINQNGGSDDLLLLFFAGHGVETPDGHFLMASDTKVRDSDGKVSEGATISSSLKAGDLTSMIESVNVRHRIMMIDTCRTHPGRLNQAGESYEKQFILQSRNESGSRATYLSTRRGHNAYESKARGRGFFSFFLEQGLTGAAAGHTKEVTLSSLDDYLNQEVRIAVDRELRETQHPIAFLSDGALPLVRRDRMTTTPALAILEGSKSRTIRGIVRNTDKRLLANATVTIRRRSPASRDLKLAAPRNDSPASRPDYVTRSDEDGYFKIDGLPTDVELEIHVELPGHKPQTVAAVPEREMFPVSLPRDGETLSAIAAAPPAGLPSGAPAVPRGLDLAGLAGREHAMVARESFLVEEFDVAGDDAREALTFDPGNALAHAVLGNVLASEVTRDEATPRARRNTLLREARGHIDQALAADPQLALAHNARGLVFFAEGRLNEAQAEFATATKLDAALSVAHANLASVHQRRKRWTEAETSFRQAIALRPDNAIPYNGLAGALLGQKRYGEAVLAARDAIAQHDGSDLNLADFYVNLATIQYDAGNQDAALNAVANAKNLGRKEHKAFKQIERGR